MENPRQSPKKLPPGYHICMFCGVEGHVENMEICREKTGLHSQCRGPKFFHSHKCIDKHLELPEKKSPVKVSTKDTALIKCKECGELCSLVNMELCPLSGNKGAKCVGNYYHKKCLYTHSLKRHAIL